MVTQTAGQEYNMMVLILITIGENQSQKCGVHICCKMAMKCFPNLEKEVTKRHYFQNHEKNL